MHPPADETRAVFGPGPVSVTPLAHTVVASATAGLWRVRSGDRTAVVKLLAHDAAAEGNWRSGTDPGHWYYWRREADAYASGVLAGLRGGLRAPACQLVAERRDGSVAVWLEDLAAAISAPRWALSRYEVAARHLGRAQGTFVVEGLPGDPWLSRGWLRDYLAQRTDTALPEVWSHPLLAPWFPDPPATAAALRRMQASQPRYLAVLSSLPVTLCHLDVHPANLFAPADRTTAAIDWAFTGLGAVGEDPGNLVPDASLDFHVPPSALDHLHERVVAGYHAGLAAAGVDLTVDDVRVAMAAAVAAKYAWIGPALLRAVAEGRPLLNRRPLAAAVAAWAPTVHYLLARAAEV
jgi:hypothetical protein